MLAGPRKLQRGNDAMGFDTTIAALQSGDIALWLPLAWAALLGTAVALYVILDGFDLGLGILFPVMPAEDDRDVMMNTVAPFWDGNETWLVLGGGGLFVAFPKAYAIIMPAVYLPLIFAVYLIKQIKSEDGLADRDLVAVSQLFVSHATAV